MRCRSIPNPAPPLTQSQSQSQNLWIAGHFPGKKHPNQPTLKHLSNLPLDNVLDSPQASADDRENSLEHWHVERGRRWEILIQLFFSFINFPWLHEAEWI
jgi:hypothetical protein